MTTWGLICSDIAYSHDVADLPASTGGRVRFVAARCFKMKSLVVIIFRLAHRCGERRMTLAADLLKMLNHAVTGADIAHGASFGPALRVLHPGGVVVGPDVRGGARITIHQNCTLGSLPGGSPTLGDNVHLAPGAVILGPVRLGNDVRVGANAVVTKSVEEDGVTLLGVPARIHRRPAAGPGL